MIAENTLLLSFVLSNIGILLLGFLTLFATRQETIAADWVAHTQTVIAEIETTHRLALDAESTGRAFLLSGNQDNFVRYQQLILQLYESVASVKKTTADNPNQQRRADILLAELKVRFNHFTDRLEIRQGGGRAGLRAMPYDGRASADMERVTTILLAMGTEELQLLEARKVQRDISIYTLRASIIALLLIGTGVLLWLWRRTVAEVRLRRTAEESSHQQAHHDPLTGLQNSRSLREYVDRALIAAQRHAHQMGILFIDLDGFKQVNDIRGHDVGNALLKEVAQRLGATVRREDIVARIGGDEFVIVLRRLDSASEVHRMTKRVVDSLAHPYATTNGELSVTASIGIALYPDHGRDWDVLCKNADSALYAAKRAGKNTYVVFDSADRCAVQPNLAESDTTAPPRPRGI